MKLKQILLCASAGLLLFNACKKDDDVTIVTPPVLKKDSVINKYTTRDTFGVYNVKEMPVVFNESGEYGYFSFDKAAFLGDSIAKTTKWDVSITAAEILCNYGGTAPNYWDAPSDLIAGSGSVKVKGFCVKKDFNSIVKAPEDNEFPAFPDNLSFFTASLKADTANANAFMMRIMDSETGRISYLVPLNNHRTALIMLNDGRYVKMEWFNIYKGNIQNPSKADYVYPNNQYMTFRYFISKPGSKDLTTK